MTRRNINTKKKKLSKMRKRRRLRKTRKNSMRKGGNGDALKKIQVIIKPSALLKSDQLISTVVVNDTNLNIDERLAGIVLGLDKKKQVPFYYKEIKIT
jgi:hypothetical protein